MAANTSEIRSLGLSCQKFLFDFRMLLSKLFLSRSAWSEQVPESTKIRLPTEIWIHIWSFLDFNTLQKICILVSKEWFCKIRNSATLSGEMILRLENRNAKDINNVLSLWPKLKVLKLSDCNCESRQDDTDIFRGSQISEILSKVIFFGLCSDQ